MIVKPTTTKLVKESNCNKFKLVIATAKRARQISQGSEILTDVDEPSAVTLAANEIAEGKVEIC